MNSHSDSVLQIYIKVLRGANMSTRVITSSVSGFMVLQIYVEVARRKHVKRSNYLSVLQTYVEIQTRGKHGPMASLPNANPARV
jgi:hypothetical protein